MSWEMAGVGLVYAAPPRPGTELSVHALTVSGVKILALP